MQPSRPCPKCQAPLPEGAVRCAACGAALHQRTLIGVPALSLQPRAATPARAAQPAPAPLQAPIAAADQTAIGPPQPAEPAWARAFDADDAAMAAPTLLDSRPFAAIPPEVTPAGGHPALPKAVAQVVAPRPDPLAASPETPTATPAATPTAPPAATPAPARRRTPHPGRDTIAADAIRRATEETARAAQPAGPSRRGYLALGLIAALAVAIAIFAWSATRFRARLAGDLSVTRTSSGYAVDVGIHTSSAAVVHHPGGAVTVDGDARVRFEVDARQMALGDNPVDLRVTADGTERTLTLHVMVYYHLRAPDLRAPRAGTPVSVSLQIEPGWTVALHSPGAATPAADGTVDLKLNADAAVKAAAPGEDVVLPVDFSLTGPNGEQERFVEKLRLPPPAERLSVAAPARGWALPASSVLVVGRAAPGARLRIGDLNLTADDTGRFEARVPLPTPGLHRLRVEALAPDEAVVEIDVRRVEPATAKARVGEAQAALPPTTRPPAYADLLADQPPSGLYAFEGALLSVRRGVGEAPDAAQVATCVGEGGCVVWAELAHPPLAAVGAPVRLVGRLVGRRRYPTRFGTVIDVPRLVDARVLPR